MIEKSEIDEKLNKLRAFMAHPIFTTLDGSEQYLLRHQHNAMQEYSRIRGERIAALT